MDIGTRVRVLSSKLDHPSAQRLDGEQFERLRAEVRTLRWVVRERLHRPEWSDLIAQVEAMVERVERLDPALAQEVEVPTQARVSQERVPEERLPHGRVPRERLFPVGSSPEGSSGSTGGGGQSSAL